MSKLEGGPIPMRLLCLCFLCDPWLDVRVTWVTELGGDSNRNPRCSGQRTGDRNLWEWDISKEAQYLFLFFSLSQLCPEANLRWIYSAVVTMLQWFGDLKLVSVASGMGKRAPVCVCLFSCCITPRMQHCVTVQLGGRLKLWGEPIFMAQGIGKKGTLVVRQCGENLSEVGARKGNALILWMSRPKYWAPPKSGGCE
jgi:hypothetical protein